MENFWTLLPVCQCPERAFANESAERGRVDLADEA